MLDRFKAVLDTLVNHGLSEDFPGFDILTLDPNTLGRPDRLIELKSSGVNAKVQAMTWNEWKTARDSDLRRYFYLYLVGNLRADLPHATPFIRSIHDPFANLWRTEVVESVHRTVQLNIQEFDSAEHLNLRVAKG